VKYTEVYLTPDDLIERGVAIDIHSYNNAEEPTKSSVYIYGGRLFLKNAKTGYLNLIKNLDVDISVGYNEQVVKHGLVDFGDDDTVVVLDSASEDEIINDYKRFVNNI